MMTGKTSIHLNKRVEFKEPEQYPSSTYTENTQSKLFGPVDTEEDKNRFQRKNQILKEEHEKNKNKILSKYEYFYIPII